VTPVQAQPRDSSIMFTEYTTRFVATRGVVIHDRLRKLQRNEGVSHLRPLETPDEANHGPSAVKMREVA